jgi:hypothetical protein
LVLQSGLNFEASITRIEWQSAGTFGNAPFRLFELRFCHTSVSELTSNLKTNYGGNTPVLVHSANPLLLTGRSDEWFGFDLTTTFPYNNKDNLIIEPRWDNGKVETACDTWGWSTGKNWGWISKEYNGESGQLFAIICRFRLTFDDQAVAPTSLGRVRALYR